MKHGRPPHLQDGAVGALITSLVERLQRCQLVPVDRCGRANFEPFVGALSAAQFTLNDEQKWAKGAPLSLLSSDAKFKVIRPSVRRLIDSASRALPSARSGSQLFSARCLCVCAFKTHKNISIDWMMKRPQKCRWFMKMRPWSRRFVDGALSNGSEQRPLADEFRRLWGGALLLLEKFIRNHR